MPLITVQAIKKKRKLRVGEQQMSQIAVFKGSKGVSAGALSLSLSLMRDRAGSCLDKLLKGAQRSGAIQAPKCQGWWCWGRDCLLGGGGGSGEEAPGCVLN